MRLAILGLVVIAFAGCEGRSSAGTGTAAEAAPAVARPAPVWQAGTALTDVQAIAVADVALRGPELADKNVRVEGTVTGVCQHRGCWVEISDGQTKVIARSVDHTIAFPHDATGKQMVIEGVLRVHAATSCTGEMHAATGGESHECPRPDTMVEVRHAELRPAS